jgi:GTP cyclohydrolase IA
MTELDVSRGDDPPYPPAARPMASAIVSGPRESESFSELDEPMLPPVDQPRIERAVREILLAMGEDPERDGLRDTPARVARMYAEQFAGLRQRPEDVLTTVFDAEHDEIVLVRDIEIYSMCEHHLVPFFGKAHIGYIPNAKGEITGLSKLARLADLYARRPQVQERMTCQIADALMRILEPRGVIVVIECEHLCMSMRGVRKPGATTVTSAVRGIFRREARTRAEAMSLLFGNRLSLRIPREYPGRILNPVRYEYV